MPIYMVEPPQSAVGSRKYTDGVIVTAQSPGQARDMADSLQPSDSRQGWQAAVVTELVENADINTAGSMEDFEMQVTVLAPDGGAVVADVVVKGQANDKVDDLADRMVTALIAAGLANAAYASPAFTVATIPDGIGDHRMIPIIRLKRELFEDSIGLSSMLGSIVDEGIAAAVLTFSINTATVTPSFFRDYRFSPGAKVPLPY